MGTTRDEYNRLLRARNSGALTVRYADRQVQYRSLDEMDRILAAMRQDLGVGSPVRSRYLSTSKGL